MSPTTVFHGTIPCVAHFYLQYVHEQRAIIENNLSGHPVILLKNEQTPEECDATKV
jgi:hypothetical protein